MAKSKEKFGSAVTAMLWPFGALLLSLRNIRSEQSKVFFFVFCLWVGAIFIFNSTDFELTSANVGKGDGSKVALRFYETSIQNSDFKTYYNNRDKHDRYDFFQVLSFFFLSKVSSNPRLWFLYVAIIYGFFLVNNLWYVLERCRNPITWYSALFMGLMFFMLPITEGLNATRMNLAIQVFLFGLLPLLIGDNKKRIWVPFLSILFHFSMFMAIALLLLYLILPKRNIVPICILFFVSLFINELDLEAVKSVLEYLPFGLGDRTGGYLTDASMEYEENWRRQSSLIYTLNFKALSYISVVLIIVFFTKDSGHILKSTPWFKLLYFALLFGSFANVLAILPSGYRFLRISNYLLFSWFLLTINNLDMNKFKPVFVLLTPLIVFKLIFSLRMMFDYLGFEVLWGNFLATILVNDNVCISKVLGLSI